MSQENLAGGEHPKYTDQAAELTDILFGIESLGPEMQSQKIGEARGLITKLQGEGAVLEVTGRLMPSYPAGEDPLRFRGELAAGVFLADQFTDYSLSVDDDGALDARFIGDVSVDGGGVPPQKDFHARLSAPGSGIEWRLLVPTHNPELS